MGIAMYIQRCRACLWLPEFSNTVQDFWRQHLQRVSKYAKDITAIDPMTSVSDGVKHYTVYEFSSANYIHCPLDGFVVL